MELRPAVAIVDINFLIEPHVKVCYIHQFIVINSFQASVCMLFFMIDVDECEESPCEQWCTDTEGSFFCSCNSGFMLSSDRLQCNGTDSSVS